MELNENNGFDENTIIEDTTEFGFLDPLKKHNLSPRKAAIISITYFFVSMFLGALLFQLFSNNPKFIVDYSETDALIEVLQTKNAISIIKLDDFNTSSFKADVTKYNLEDGYLLITTKGLFTEKDTRNLDGPFLRKIFADNYIHKGYKVYRVLPNNIEQEFYDFYEFVNIPTSDVTYKAYSSISNTASGIINFIAFTLITVVVVGISFSVLKAEVLRLENVKTAAGQILIGLGIVYLFNMSANAIVLLLSALFKERVVDSQNQVAIINMLKGDYAFFIIVSVIILGPFIEEMVFRKSMFSLIKNKKAAYIVSALLFGIIHVLGETSIATFVISLIPYLAPGLALGYIYMKNDENVLIPTVVHMLLNGLSVILILFI